MRLIIRADASASVGTGHVMRSSTLAAEFLKLGHTVCYTGAIEPMNLILERFRELGIPYPVLAPEEFEPDQNSDILLIDSYSLNPSEPFILKEKWAKVIAISDSVTPDYDVDLIIRTSLIPRPITRTTIPTLTGPKYILLRSSVKKATHKDFVGSSPISILVAGGGSDPSGFCNAMIKVLQEFSFDYIANVFSDNIESVGQPDSRIIIHNASLVFDEYMKVSDLALTLASSLAVELIASEIPIGVACGFDNQRIGFNELVVSGFASPIGERDESGKWILDKAAIELLIISESSRVKLKERISGLIDMRGPERIALEILKF